MNLRKLKKIDKDISLLNKKLSFFAINPTNLEQEKEKFFKDNTYNPQFKYSKYRQDLKKIKKSLRKNKPGNSTLGRLLAKKRNNLIIMSDILKNRGIDKNFTKFSLKLYGKPDKELVKAAKKYLRLKTPRKRNTLTSKQVIKQMKKAFVKYGFEWDIIEKEMVSKAAVNASKRKVMVRKDTKFPKDIVKRLIVHEIGTHVMRIENGRRQPFRIFSDGFPDYLMTEEGLAVVNEELNDCLDNRTLKAYAGRVIAIDKSLKCSFRETYNHLRKYFSKPLAFRLTARAKRGLTDTSLKGACTKDIAYLKGYLEIKKYLKKGGQLDKLYYGKIGIQHSNVVEKIPGVIHPYYLPMFRYLSYFLGQFGKLFTNIVIIGLTPLIVLKPIKDVTKPITDYFRPYLDPVVNPLKKVVNPYKKQIDKHFARVDRIKFAFVQFFFNL